MLNVNTKGHDPSYGPTLHQQLPKPGRWHGPEELKIQRSLGRCSSTTLHREQAVRRERHAR